jgi:hypothetical protein
MILQLIGLPCSGKSLVIEKIKQSKYSVKYFDLRSYHGLHREKRMLSDIKATAGSNNLIIVESACGLEKLNSIVVMLRVSDSQLKFNQRQRKELKPFLSKYQLIDQMLPPNYTVYDTNSCETLIKTILNTESQYVSNSKATSYSRNN